MRITISFLQTSRQRKSRKISDFQATAISTRFSRRDFLSPPPPCEKARVLGLRDFCNWTFPNTDSDKKELSRIFKIASEGGKNYKIVNFDKNANPEEFISPNGKDYIRFDWDNHYDGSRNLVDWFDWYNAPQQGCIFN